MLKLFWGYTKSFYHTRLAKKNQGIWLFQSHIEHQSQTVSASANVREENNETLKM